MDLKQKYIEETKPYELDEAFLDQLREIPIKHSVPIAVLIDVLRTRSAEKCFIPGTGLAMKGLFFVCM